MRVRPVAARDPTAASCQWNPPGSTTWIWIDGVVAAG